MKKNVNYPKTGCTCQAHLFPLRHLLLSDSIVVYRKLSCRRRPREKSIATLLRILYVKPRLQEGKNSPCLSMREVSIDLGKAFKEGFVEEALPRGSIVGWKVAENSSSVLLVHGQDDAHRQLSNCRCAVLQRRRAELQRKVQ